jgi:uncharacterized protein (DUF1330 family)
MSPALIFQLTVAWLRSDGDAGDQGWWSIQFASLRFEPSPQLERTPPMSAYFVMIREQTIDPVTLADYGPRASLAAQGHPLKPLATYGTLDQLEGDPIEGAVILEFPDMAAARAWYDSPSYQAAVKFRHAGSKSTAFFIEGL